MPSSDNRCLRVLSKYGRDMSDDLFMNTKVIRVKTSMNLTTQTIRKISFLKITVFKPISPTTSPPERNNYLISLLSITDKTMRLCNSIVDIKNVSQFQRTRSLASPCLQTLLSTKSNCCELDYLLRSSQIVVSSRCSKDRIGTDRPDQHNYHDRSFHIRRLLIDL